MKKLFCRMLALMLALFLPLSACAEESDSPLVAVEQEIMDQLLQAMGRRSFSGQRTAAFD